MEIKIVPSSRAHRSALSPLSLQDERPTRLVISFEVLDFALGTLLIQFAVLSIWAGGMATYPGVGDFLYSIHCLKEKDYELGCIGKLKENGLLLEDGKHVIDCSFCN